MILLEAMASGCCILATDVGGINSIIKSGYNGILVKAKDIEELVINILFLLKNDNIRQKYAIRSKKLFYEKLTAEVMTKNYEKLYLLK